MDAVRGSISFWKSFKGRFWNSFGGNYMRKASEGKVDIPKFTHAGHVDRRDRHYEAHTGWSMTRVQKQTCRRKLKVNILVSWKNWVHTNQVINKFYLSRYLIVNFTSRKYIIGKKSTYTCKNLTYHCHSFTIHQFVYVSRSNSIINPVPLHRPEFERT